MGNSMSITSDFDKLAAQFEQMGAAKLRTVAEKMLREVHSAVTPKAAAAMSSHVRTGRTLASIKAAPDFKWNGDVASVDVGFILKRGWKSILHTWGTPRMAGDQALYDALFGTDDIVQSAAMKAISEFLK